MSEYLYERSFLVAAPVELVARFFSDGEAWYRLNPEWEVLSFTRTDGQQMLKVRYERSEQEAEYCRPHVGGETSDCRLASADFSSAGGEITFIGESARTITLTLTAHGDKHTRIDWREAFAEPIETARLAELNLWLDAAAGYLAFATRSDRKARLAHWLLDRVWLRMSPTSRRISLMIVGMEFLALLLFIAIVIVYRFIN